MEYGSTKPSQWWHLNGFSQVWRLSCTLRSSFCTKSLVTLVALECFLQVCSLLCTLRSSFCTKVLSQCWHLNGFSRVWILLCTLRSSLSTKFLSQWLQLNCLSCTLRLSFRMNFLSKLNCNKQGFNQMTSLLNLTQLFRLNEWFKW